MYEYIAIYAVSICLLLSDYIIITKLNLEISLNKQTQIQIYPIGRSSNRNYKKKNISE